ncbi:5371_t:CDS:2 [Scutellospora calospora]|uniref:5371_t:CDS:1 n=1 Tax=Scutellospora calospora TaxID=85575 RepID=A0ACA9JUB6_9GLOM|nr:5371_t:CDS:2 [Scutellospora calospora]
MVEQKAEDIVNNGKKLVCGFLEIKKKKLPLELHVKSSSDPGNCIVDFIRENRIDVLVLGNRELNVPKSFSLGDISQHCLNFAPCTVVIARKKSESLNV